jgi:hypothetical protein
VKTPEYLSPTRINMFYDDPQNYYLNYLSDNRPEKEPQTAPMSVGSAFDAYAKSYLHEALFGKGYDPKYDLNAIFEAQVEAQHRDIARVAGEYVFKEYMKSGALADLLLELQGSIVKPKFEFEIKGVINGQREGVTRDIGPVTFLGKPDVFFINKAGAHVILDWKVNGFYSQYPPSPMKGFVRLRKNGVNSGQHKEAALVVDKGVMINAGCRLEHCNVDWARQLTIYAWLCGEDIGGDYIVAVDQLVCNTKNGVPNQPEIRVAEHRLKVSKDHQWRIFAEAQWVWEVSTSGHFFRDMSLQESQARCQALDQIAVSLKSDNEKDRWFAEVCR